MAKAYAESFYNGMTWRKTSKAFMKSKYYICVNFRIISDWFNHNKTDRNVRKSVKNMVS